MYKLALQIAKDHKMPPGKAIFALDGLSSLYLNARRYAEAERCLNTKLAIMQRDSTLYAAQLVSTTLSLGVTYSCLKKYDLAARNLKSVLEQEQRTGAVKLSRIAAFRLAEVYEKIGDDKKQESICRWFFDQLNQPERQDAVMFWTGKMLAKICLHKHQFKEAEQLLHQCLLMPTTIRGVTIKDRVEVIRLLGDCYLLQGRKAEALDSYQKGLARAGSTKDLDEVRCLLQLGVADVYTATAKYKEAEQLYKSSLAKLDVMWGKTKALAEQMQRYAKLLKVTGRKQEYDALQQKRLQILKRSLTSSTKH